jgi:glycine oxidase
LTERRGFDAIFVGGGVIGLACAWRAAQRGARVAVLERARPPAGATGVAAGMLAPIGELAFGEGELLEMALASSRLYPAFVAELEAATGEATGYRRHGALHVALDRDEAAQLRRVHDQQRSLGLEAEWLPPRRCRELEPRLTPSFHGGVHAPAEAAVDPRALARALLAALAAEGAEVRTGADVVAGLWSPGSGKAAQARVSAGERLAGVRTATGEELRAEAIVLAAGAWSGRAEWLPGPARPPVRPVKGQVVELRSRDGAPPCERIVASERVYLVPRADGRLIVGATSEEQGFDTTVTAGGVHELLREGHRLLPDVAEMELVDSLAGLRPGTPDNLPLVGPGAVEGLLLAAGHYRNGILLAPLTADAIAAQLAGEPAAGAIAAADPRRPQLVAQGETNGDRNAESGERSAEMHDRAAELAERGADLAEAAERVAEGPR